MILIFQYSIIEIIRGIKMINGKKHIDKKYNDINFNSITEMEQYYKNNPLKHIESNNIKIIKK